MGEVILRDEGYEVVSVTDGNTALLRLGDVDPDLVLADVDMPLQSGYQICEFVKNQPRHRHTRVLITFGAGEAFDQVEVERVGADGIVRKPFEASEVLAQIKPLLDAALADRAARGDFPPPEPEPPIPGQDPDPPPPDEPDVPDVERVRAAITLALDDAMTDIVERITDKVMVALGAASGRN